MRRIFVTGTDTGIGKTLVSAHVMASLLAHGLDALYIKPIQTGVTSFDDPDSDAHTVGLVCGRPEAAVWIDHFTAPKAPYYAALDEGRTIDPSVLLDTIRRLEGGHDVMLLEGAGGLMVPITEHYMNIDLIADTADAVLLVARDSLGTINHTLMSLKILRHRLGDIPITVVLNGVAEGTPADLALQNVDSIKRFGRVESVFLLPHLSAGDEWDGALVWEMASSLLG